MKIRRKGVLVKVRETCTFVAFILLFIPGKSVGQYDFIVVGGGTGGCVVARRLAESGRFSVLLMESGFYPKEGNDVPAEAPKFVGDEDVTFNYRSIPQENAGLGNDGIISPIAGRMLGGSSSLNYMWFNRGSPQDYDNWAKLTGDDSWNYGNMLKYFKKVETYLGDFPSDQHGYNGPITVSRPKYAPGLEQWLDAGRSLGYKVADSNGPQEISFAPVEFAKKFGRRVSSYTGYLKPIEARNNIHVMTHTNATRLIFKDRMAIGVEFHTESPSLKGFPFTSVYAKKEIIISAGAYESPLLLQRSGVGPADILKSAGIPIVKELPVGLNFHDHVALPLHLNIRNRSVVLDESRDLTSETLAFYNLYGDGPYSNTRGGTGQAFVASSIAKSEGEGNWADLHICMAHSTEPYLAANILSNSTEEDNEGPNVPISAPLFLTRPESKGNISINPKDPSGAPILHMGYFTKPNDILRLYNGIQEALKIFEETPPYRKLGARVVTYGFDECSKEEERSMNFWKCYIKHISQAGLHPGGTCRMGHGPDDPQAVVDSKLKVIDIQGLRVVDASIMPYQTNANTQGAVYGIAEKASEMILKDWDI